MIGPAYKPQVMMRHNQSWQKSLKQNQSYKLPSAQNKISPIKMAYKKMTGVKWGQAPRTNFGHLKLKHPPKRYRKRLPYIFRSYTFEKQLFLNK